MYINPLLFDECFCPCNGIARVCLRGDRELPIQLVDLGKKIDKQEYCPSCFAIDLFIENQDVISGVINYSGELEFVECFVCDNFEQAWNFYKQNVSQEEYNQTVI